ncbi:predicted protein [Nematostella vectensis]|uniref:BZIP domain-containing protein n=1 Tax=Nematostella vectensis TaxID=45351 RepID=A7S1F0_NEMVE|nr:predicted protein [Nematostella vectensis]|eukprot:XP_001634510.1 predicted protein [Nematostella vectensis]
MSEETKECKRRCVKRSKSETESEDEDSYPTERRQQINEGESEDEIRSVYCCRSTPHYGETTSLNNILKVVSLQSFSNSRLASDPGSNNRHFDSSAREQVQRNSVIISAPSKTKCEPEKSDREKETPQINGIYTPTVFNTKSSSRGKRTEKHFNNNKDNKYWEKRQRNNASAKRSRDARRVRELECQIRAEFLEEENHKYKVENEMLREENERLLKIIESFNNKQ